MTLYAEAFTDKNAVVKEKKPRTEKQIAAALKQKELAAERRAKADTIKLAALYAAGAKEKEISDKAAQEAQDAKHKEEFAAAKKLENKLKRKERELAKKAAKEIDTAIDEVLPSPPPTASVDVSVTSEVEQPAKRAKLVDDVMPGWYKEAHEIQMKTLADLRRELGEKITVKQVKEQAKENALTNWVADGPRVKKDLEVVRTKMYNDMFHRRR